MNKGVLCLLAAILTVLFGCAPRMVLDRVPPGQKLFWPSPPAEAKIHWVKEIRHQGDAGIEKSFWARVGAFLVGERNMGIVKPYGVLFDQKDRLVIVDSGGAVLHIMDAGKGRYSTVNGKDRYYLKSPIAVTEDERDNLYFTDSATGKIFSYNLKNQKLQPFTAYPLTRPTGIGFNRVNGLIYVSDTAAHQIVAFDELGNKRFHFGRRGTEAGEFNYPTDLHIDKQGRIIATDALNARIQIFAPDGKHLASFGDSGNSMGHFAKPKGVAVDSEGHIYVCDAELDMVQIFDEAGQLLLAFGESGSGPGQFWMPSGIFIDHNDMIYVADTYNQRIQVFQYIKSDAFDASSNKKLQQRQARIDYLCVR